jgi:hypothetical protein
MATLIGLGLFVVIAAVAVWLLATFNPKEWVRTDDPTVIELIENYEKLPEEKKRVIRDFADDG